jgi:hypothetical protein
MKDFKRRALPYNASTMTRFEFEHPCKHCDLGTGVMGVANYSCPEGRHDVAVMIDDGFNETFALNFYTKEARCWAVRLSLRAEAVDALNFRGDPGLGGAYSASCGHCGLGSNDDLWLTDFEAADGSYVVAIGFDLSDVSRAIACTPDEARCLAFRLSMMAEVVDDANKDADMERELTAIIARSNY